MKLKKPIEVSSQLLNNINFVKDKMIVHKNGMWRITDVVIEDVKSEKTTGFFKKKKVIVTKTSITEINIWGWHPTKKFWGTLTDESSIQMYLWLTPLEEARHNFVNLKEALDNVGFEIKKKPEFEKGSDETVK